jgi:hypothetical protein
VSRVAIRGSRDGEVSIAPFEEIVAPLRNEHAEQASGLLDRWVREPFASRADDLFDALLEQMDLLEPHDWNELVSDAIAGLMAGPPLAAEKFRYLLRFLDA